MRTGVPWLKLAFRSLLRNRRRSIVTIAAAALGFAAVNVFSGFTAYMFENLRDSFVNAQANGHLQVYREGQLERGTTDPDGTLLPDSVLATIRGIAAEDRRILIAAPRLQVAGQIDTGRGSSIFMGRAIAPSDYAVFFEGAKTLKDLSFFAHGIPLTGEGPDAIGVAFGLMDALDLELGDQVVLIARTVGGQVNAVDATVKSSFGSPSAELRDKLIVLPLALAQDLCQTDGVGSVAILLRDESDTSTVRDLLRAKLGEGIVVAAWDDAASTYNLTRRMFDLIFGVVYAILAVIVSMSVANTMGMTILERTIEIGTLRAIGLKRHGVLYLFGVEGALLGLIGSAAGLLLTLAIWLCVRLGEPTWTPPSLGEAVPLELILLPTRLVLSAACLSGLTLAAAIVPARRAARATIVEALGHA